MVDSKTTGGSSQWLPTHAIINFDVLLDTDDKPVVDANDNFRMEFHSNMRAGKRALLLHDIKSTTREVRGAKVYKAQVVDLDNARFPAHVYHANERSTLFYIHGFNNDITGVFEACKRYHEKYKYRQVVPVIWADHQLGIRGYLWDKVWRVDPAGQAIKDFIRIANRWAFPRRSLVCHSMGNFVLQRLARDVGQSKELTVVPFDDIFMVAADVSTRVFNKGRNRTPGQSDGLGILNLARNRVHVLHSWWDFALKVRVVPNFGQRALGAHGYNDRLLADTAANKLVQVDCSNRAAYPCHDWMGHNYQFEDWAMAMYENVMNAPAKATQSRTPAPAALALSAAAGSVAAVKPPQLPLLLLLLFILWLA